MNQYKTSLFLLALCLICAFALASNMFRLARADYTAASTIYIKANGSISPNTAPITSSDNITYTLTENITCAPGFSGNVIEIQRSNIVFDGTGKTITGPGGSGVHYGVHFANVDNVTIENTRIRAVYTGILGEVTSWGSSINLTRIVGNDIESNYGVWLASMTCFDNVSWNNITAETPGNNYGVYLLGWDGWGAPCSNLISHNNVSNFAYGIYIYGNGAPCFDNTISQNNITQPNSNFGTWLSNAPFTSVLGNDITLVGEAAMVFTLTRSEETVVTTPRSSETLFEPDTTQSTWNTRTMSP
jgi:hypothetical protein